MSHLTHEALWAYVSGEGGAQELSAARAHLDGCADCRAQLQQVTFAQSLLKPRGAPPPLSDAAARRIGNVLAEAAEAEALKRMGWRSWFSWRPLAVVAVAALLLWFLWPAKVEAPLPPVALPSLDDARDERGAHQAEPLVEPQGEAQVTSARKAKLENGALAKSQVLKVGSKVSTEAGGALWLKLPDGTRAGLSAQSEVTLEAMGEKRVALEVKKGNLIVVAKHDPNRQLRVYAGEIEVRDVGTRFLVAREERKVAVAVEEGEVEVRLGEKVVPVKAGQGVEIARGRMRELPLAPAPAPPSQQQAKVESPARLTPDLSGTPEVPEAGTEVAVHKPVVEDLPPPPPQPVAAAVDAGAPAAQGAPTVVGTPPPEEPLDSIGLAFRKFGEALARPFKPTRAMLADRIDGLATEGNCEDVQKEARTWLARDAGTAKEELQLRHLVLRAQLRCYTRSGKRTEAEEVRKQLPP
jgi:hypothetical protein